MAGMAAGTVLAASSAALAATCRRSPRASAGPFFRKGAPERTALDDLEGEPLVVTGRVVVAGPAGPGQPCAPVANAVIDAWQADERGTYDMDGFRGRARLRTDGDGRFELRTILPGRYGDAGRRLRPAHIHLFVRGRGRPSLTTQLYFEGDPYLAGDRLVRQELVGRVTMRAGVRRAAYQLAL